MKPTITSERLHELLEYEPDTGAFVRRQRAGRMMAGTKAGSITGNGYRIICVDRGYYYAHRLAWLYMTGEWPRDDIDHINRRRDDNRWSNLRAATRAQNLANTGPQKNNTSGFRGVCRCGRKWRARIVVNGKGVHLGYFDNAAAASKAYERAAQHHFGFGSATDVATLLNETQRRAA